MTDVTSLSRTSLNKLTNAADVWTDVWAEDRRVLR
jgi:hypothetical protein